MYSFLLARSLVREDVLVMNSDLFFHPALVARLLDQGGDALLYDSGSGDEEEQMKVRVSDGRLVEMSKALPSDQVCGENVGMLHLAPATVEDAFAAARAIAANGGEQAWLASAINRVAVDHRIRCLDVVGWPWVEIDFPADLRRARTEVLPQVADGLGRSEPA
jgi:choline kinase